jgi:putative SOS response-associated peptidase YedK
VGAEPGEIAEKLGAELADGVSGAPARYNVAPSQPAPLLVAVPERRLGLARFGWNVRGKRELLVNARVEGLDRNGLFKKAGERHRALVPADGFYEWHRTGKDKRAYFLRGADAQLLTFAALFDVGRKPEEASDEKPAREPGFVIVTRSPGPVSVRIHDREPLIVPPSLRDLWLSRAPLDEALAALATAQPDLEAWEVGSRVGSTKFDEPGLRDAIGPPP